MMIRVSWNYEQSTLLDFFNSLFKQFINRTSLILVWAVASEFCLGTEKESPFWLI